MANIGYATLKRPNKAETADQGCLDTCPADIAVRMLTVTTKARGWCNVCPPFFYRFTFSDFQDDCHEVRVMYIYKMATFKPASAVKLFAAKSEKIFQDAIMLEIFIKIDLHLLKVTLFFCREYCYHNVLISLWKE